MKKNRHAWLSDRVLLYSYFLALILIGSVLLSLPVSWSGGLGLEKVFVIDAIFTAVSAACVTGLVTIDTSLWSRVGQTVILLLIQAGGLGIIAFGMFYLVLPRARISLRNTRFLRDSFVVGGFLHGRSIIRNIIVTTFLIEGLGFFVLTLHFHWMGIPSPVFAGAFHAVSAFCNAGFSLFNDSLAGFRGNGGVNITMMLLIILGGIGFMVIRDLRQKVRNWRRPLLFHTRMMLIATSIFILVGFLGYILLDAARVFADLPLGERILAALFQSITTRTAGFNTIDQAALSPTSRWLTLVLMLIGGGSGSTAGGIKVSTAFILILVLCRGVNERGDIKFLGRRITAVDVGRAAMFFLKAIAILFLAILTLGIIENPVKTGFTASDLVFECVSALGTVGLSTGITANLSPAGKMVIIITMFTGRVGLFSLVIRAFRNRAERLIDYPKGEVLIG